MSDGGALEAFVVGLTSDFLDAGGHLTYQDIGLDILASEPGIEYRFLPPHPMTMSPEHLRGLDAIISLAPSYTEQSFADDTDLLAILRFGVGYDIVDVEACTSNGIAVAITPGAVDHTMAESILAWMLALAHRVREKDQLVRAGRWADKNDYIGSELRDRQLGIIGCGGIGRRLVEMIGGFGMERPLVYDPYLDAEEIERLGATSTSLGDLMRRSDFISINCPLTEETTGLVGATELESVKEGAYLINAARGGIVDEDALVDALGSGRLAGAAVDVFEAEPAGADHPLAGLENTILAPHAIGWTHELFREIGRMACRSAVKLSRGELPDGLVNPEVVEVERFQAKLQAAARRGT